MNLSQLSAVLNADCISLADPVNLLKEKGWLEACSPSNLNPADPITMHIQLRISYQGKIALEEERSANANRFWGEFRAWVTLAISVAAFIKSFFF